MKNLSLEAKYLISFINNTNRSVFLTGKAGTGKTTLLKEIINSTHKNKVVVAPTGVAALNAKGVTIHSFFQIPPATFIPDPDEALPVGGGARFENSFTLTHHLRMNSRRRQIFKDLELLIIDEISMVRADLLDAIDFILRYIRRKDTPFGGVQLLFIGDLYQLPPIVKNEEWNVLRKFYSGIFFFNSKVIENNKPIYIELEKVFRQKDQNFISILNDIRHNKLSEENVELLNKLVDTSFDTAKNPGYITLTTHNEKADAINHNSYLEIKESEYTYTADIVGEFPENIFPIDPIAKFKEGCQVIFVKNDLSGDKKYFNGKIGFIHKLNEDYIKVRFPEDDEIIDVDRYEWQNIRYNIDAETKEIKEDILGTFTHYPIKLAWAITVHKSQGLTLEKVVLDISRVFAPGQAYVALSRIRSLEKLVLLSPMKINGVNNSSAVIQYETQKTSKDLLKNELDSEKKRFLMSLLIDAYSWKHLLYLFNKHVKNYSEEKNRSKKERFKDWAFDQSKKFGECCNYSEKFILQLNKILNDENYDFKFVKERCDKAYDYFFPIMDEFVRQILFTMLQVSGLKKMKTFLNEFVELEDNFTKAVLKLHKSKLVLEIEEKGQEIESKESLNSDFILNYRKNAIKAVVDMLAEENINIADKSFVAPSKEKNKKSKKPTIEVTLDLWKEKHSIEDIAEIRKLTIGTIYSHLSKLLAKGELRLFEILPEERVGELEDLFQGNASANLSDIKENVGSDFSWEELRLFKAYLNASSVEN